MTDPTLSFSVARARQKTTTSLWLRLLRWRNQTPPQKPRGHGFDPEKSAKPTPTHTSATAGPLSLLPATNHNPSRRPCVSTHVTIPFWQAPHSSLAFRRAGGASKICLNAGRGRCPYLTCQSCAFTSDVIRATDSDPWIICLPLARAIFRTIFLL